MSDKLPTYRKCKQCEAALWVRNRSGYCRRCAALNPELQAKRAGGPLIKLKRAEETRRALQAKPEVKERQRLKAAEFNRSEKMRRRSLELGKTEAGKARIAKARAARAAEVFKRQGKSLSDHHLAHVPPDQRQLYLHLTRVKRLTAAEALELVTKHEAAELERFRREISGDQND